jgi:signal transduction histidine kinase
VFTLSDNGIGIPAENWQDIFVIFRGLRTRDAYAGNGIGLSICKKIIERHGGKI